MKRSTLINVAATGALLSLGFVANAANYATVPSSDTATAQQDMQITDNVKSKLEADIPAVAHAIVVTTDDGVVTLKGVALNSDYMVKAILDARSIPGVVQVKDELSVG
jgi:osmotically-inducible protein OsmY